MDEASFVPQTPELELDRRDGMPVYIQGEKNDMGDLTLTNDEQKKHEIVRLADLRGGRMQTRRLVPDLYELTLADGRTVRVHRKLRKKWDAAIRRLLTDRHGATVTHDGDAWRAEPR